MATEAQSKYITDLAVIKTKELKESKEMLVARGIVSPEAEVVKTAQSMAEITNALDDAQASQFIDALNETKTPARSRAYSDRRVRETIGILDDIKSTIDDWGF